MENNGADHAEGVARFIQSGFGELKVSEARYKDLLTEADEHYLRYIEKLKETLSENL